ncbi:MAG TPA: RsmG family class I SAM-dependent methyltransferase [Gaiellaceae bacterium]|nr:RsmG family class I SAM-dependent methyltransferase [Gaiellaceae bacterium]
MRELVATPGLTAIKHFDDAWREHVERSLEAVEVVARYEGSIVDVGSGGGSPGIPLAAAFPDREVTLLESQERKAAELVRLGREFPNVKVIRGRAEEQATDRYDVAVARALAPPPVAAEWCLPLVASGGAVVLFVGPSADAEQVQRVADRVGGGEVSEEPGLLVIPKIAHTPEGFPRRPGVAKKRPLA